VRACEQAFGKKVDTEHLFVLNYERSEHLFDEGGAMSVAIELEFEEFYPRLQVVPDLPARPPSPRPFQRRHLALAIGVAVLLVLLALPIRALGGKTVAGSAPTVGQQYVVQTGDTVASIAARVDPRNAAALTQRLASEAGSPVLVPGEHLFIP
jgi:hypothetical protein